MRAHQIANGLVVNTVEVNGLTDLPGLIEATHGGIGWLWDGEVLTPPMASSEDLEAQRILGIKSQIEALEKEQLMPRATREFMLKYLETTFTTEQLSENPGYVKLKAFDGLISELRNQL